MFDEVQSEAFCFLNPDFNKECDVYIFSDIPAFSLALFNVAIDAAKNLEVIPTSNIQNIGDANLSLNIESYTNQEV
jgi:hypothetical protein